MSEGRVLHKLLTNGEYDEIEDVVIVEGEFVEVDEAGIASRQLILGLTPEVLLMAEHQIVNYKHDVSVYFDTAADPMLDSLEICSVFPICLLELTASKTIYGLIMTYCGRNRYFEMTNTTANGDLDDLWYQWLERIDYLHTDPYGFIRHMLDHYRLPYPSYLRNIEEKSDEDVLVSDHGIKVALTNRDNDYKQRVTKKRKGSKYVIRTDLDTIDKVEEMEIVGNKINKKGRNLFCCMRSDDD